MPALSRPGRSWHRGPCRRLRRPARRPSRHRATEGLLSPQLRGGRRRFPSALDKPLKTTLNGACQQRVTGGWLPGYRDVVAESRGVARAGAGACQQLRVAIEQLRVNQARLAATAEQTLASYRAVEETWRRSRMLIAHSQTGRVERNFIEKSLFARLQARLETMPVIEQAKGLIVGRTGCHPDLAFEVLREASQRANVPVRTLAAQLVKDSIRCPDAGLMLSQHEPR